MATIKSQMALDDGMSRVLSKIVNGLNTTLDAFEQVQRVSGSALDVANIEAARAGLAEAGAEVRAMEEYFRQAAERVEREADDFPHNAFQKLVAGEVLVKQEHPAIRNAASLCIGQLVRVRGVFNFRDKGDV